MGKSNFDVYKSEGVKRPTISDVARTAGVSKTTISRFLNGNVEVLAEGTRQKIVRAIADLQYQPSRTARSLKDGRSFLIGMIVADITNPYTTAILRGAENICKPNGYSLLVCNTDNDPLKERDYIFMLQSHQIDGLIIATTGHNNEFLERLAGNEIPVVLVDRKIPELHFDTVSVDNQTATQQALFYLLDQGYERIAFFTEPVYGVSSREERMSAFQAVLRSYGHPSVADVFQVNLKNPVELEASLRGFLESSAGYHRIVFAVNAVMLLHIELLAQQLGIQIPKDLSLIGFDNPDWAPLLGITVIAQPTYQIGVTAMERVLLRLQQGPLRPSDFRLPGTLIVRDSTPGQVRGG
ncbi:LacI family DNA-binding transcriptional regulator [Alicyclobacillaceae bacterium I2511]|nr:LacI family DNA-binding transcriptional regulator [Alicyclobacillaceae bacterium I2511]